jgi:AcrR family transcriptional regulator
LADRQTRKQMVTARRREQILQAALEIFSHKGFTAATIPEIARRAGLAAGTIYLYFPHKRDLFVAVIERLMMTPLQEIFSNGSEKKFLDVVQQALNNRLNILQSVALNRLMSLMSEIQRDPEIKALFVGKLLGPFISKIEDMYRTRISAGELRSVDPAIAVRLVAGMMIGLTLLGSLEGDSGPLNRVTNDRLLAEIMDFILYGLTGEKKEEKL